MNERLSKFNTALRILALVVLAGCSGMVPSMAPQRTVPDGATSDGFMGTRQGTLHTAEVVADIGPQLLTASDEKALKLSLEKILRSRGYSRCSGDAFCIPKYRYVLSVKSDPRVPPSMPYSPTHLVVRVTGGNPISKALDYTFATGLRWQGSATATFAPLLDLLSSDIPMAGS